MTSGRLTTKPTAPKPIQPSRALRATAAPKRARRAPSKRAIPKRAGAAPEKRARPEKTALARAVSDSYRKIYAVVEAIPRGKVMTYGQVADAAGLGRAARLVGYALRASKGRLPWQRVLGMRGRGIAQVAIKDPLFGTEQRIRLEAERVRFTPSGGVELARYGHVPRKRR